MNWVAGRAECSAERVFLLLGEAVEGDVNTANALNRRGVKFSLNRQDGRRLIVIRDRDVGGVSELDGVTFELGAGKISVTAASKNMREREILFSFWPAFNENGECLVRIENQLEPVNLWQARRKALEDLFFGF